MNSFVATASGPMPKNIFDAIKRYVERRIEPGHFVTAVLENNLSDALAYADPNSLAHLKVIAQFIYNDIPSPAWGSPEAVKTWLESEDSGSLITGTLEPLG